ncbi:hypothetical protein [Streptomyces lavendulae]|uniref:hypothetical protein n=1 Tax=Streptomyces lavendulae TaxID=1914 RepID=UPI002554AC5A|nr:hypothetical protein [Streptomyces lavendulae]
MSMQDACPTSRNGVNKVRHLTRPFAVGALRRGKQIEQFLGGFEHEGRQVLRWLALGPGREGITIYLSEVEDAGTATYSAIDDFPPIDPDDETWGKAIATKSTPEEALDLAERELGAQPGRWVNEGVVCSEYRDYKMAAQDAPPNP